MLHAHSRSLIISHHFQFNQRRTVKLKTMGAQALPHRHYFLHIMKLSSSKKKKKEAQQSCFKRERKNEPETNMNDTVDEFSGMAVTTFHFSTTVHQASPMATPTATPRKAISTKSVVDVPVVDRTPGLSLCDIDLSKKTEGVNLPPRSIRSNSVPINRVDVAEAAPRRYNIRRRSPVSIVRAYLPPSPMNVYVREDEFWDPQAPGYYRRRLNR
jgi:hypothetical protein